jgi:uncharacterized membrane protein
MISTNHKKITHKLRKRGWKEQHIARTLDILENAEKKKQPLVRVLDNLLYWLALFLVLAVNIVIFIGILPVIVEVPQWLVILIVSVMGLCFGFFMDIILRDINLTRKHYVFAGFLISLIAIATVFVVMEIAKYIAREIGIIIKTNPLLMVFFYILGFSLPHMLFKIKEKKSFISHNS